jgi:hypothetical protein
MPLTNGSGFGSGSSYLHHLPSRGQQRTNFLTEFFCLLLFKGTFTSFFKDKGKKEVTKQEESRFFLLFCLVIEGSGARSGSMPLNPDPDPGNPKTYGSDGPGFGFGSGSATLNCGKVYKALLISFAVL